MDTRGVSEGAAVDRISFCATIWSWLVLTWLDAHIWLPPLHAWIEHALLEVLGRLLLAGRIDVRLPERRVFDQHYLIVNDRIVIMFEWVH